MVELKFITDTLEEEFEDICKKYSLTSVLLKKILVLKIKGINNTDIAENLSIHRITVQKYVDVLKKMQESETRKVIEVVYHSTRN